jgi:pimeloyl-ACP methyl ester carboxylesterase
MPYAINEGIRIHYRVEGAGAPLVLQHGFTDSLESWYENGYVEPLKRDYQLVLVDARGHGASGKPHEPDAYAMRLRVGDILAVLRDLGISRTNYFGYSMGGWIGFGVAKYAPEHLGALIIGAASPGPRQRAGAGLLADDAIRQGAAAILKMWDASLPAAVTERILANDMDAIRAAIADDPGYEDILPAIKVPTLLIAGDVDPVYAATEAAAAKIPNARFVPLPGLSHVGALFRSDLMVPHIAGFLRAAAWQG